MKKPKPWGFCTYCTPTRRAAGFAPKRATHMHEQFPDTKDNRRLYGTELLYNSINCFPTCADCNTSHAGLELITWNELEFCRAQRIEPRSKTGIAQLQRERMYKK
jgi:hypothetical protein